MKAKTIAFSVAVMTAGLTTAHAVDGTIRFIGTISSAACSVNSIAGSTSTTGTVDFGVVSSSTLETTNAATVSTPFSIELTNCSVTEAPQITFTGDPVEDKALFATEREGVAIRIEDADNPGSYYRSGLSAANVGFDSLGGGGINSATGNFNAYWSTTETSRWESLTRI